MDDISYQQGLIHTRQYGFSRLKLHLIIEVLGESVEVKSFSVFLLGKSMFRGDARLAREGCTDISSLAPVIRPPELGICNLRFRSGMGAAPPPSLHRPLELNRLCSVNL